MLYTNSQIPTSYLDLLDLITEDKGIDVRNLLAIAAVKFRILMVKKFEIITEFRYNRHPYIYGVQTIKPWGVASENYCDLLILFPTMCHFSSISVTITLPKG